MDAKSSVPRLPKFYYNTYRQYKENESKIVRWVHITVAKIRERAHGQTAPPFRGRAQGNKARNGGTRRTQPLMDPDLSSPKFPLRLFVDLVREIAASDVVIPISKLTLLELSIKQRKTTAAFYSADAEAAENNRTHRYAIQSYSQALSILKDAEKKRAEKDGGLAETLHSALTLNPAVDDNIFALSEAIQHLSVVLDEEDFEGSPSAGSSQNEWLRDNPMVNSPKSGGKSRKPQPFPLEEYELVPDDYFESKSKKSKPAQDDTFEALRCFLLDVHNMRKYCNQVWKSVVPEGNTSHIAASFVTNKAVQLIKQMEYALLADFPALKDMHHAFEMLLEVITSQLPPGANEETLYPFKEQMMYYTWKSLQQFGNMLENNPVPVLRDGFFGYFDPLADRQKMWAMEKYVEDRCIMCNHWPDLILINRSLANKTSANDTHTFKFLGSQGLVKDFKEFHQNKARPVTWALIFACQMQADSVQARRRYLKYDLQVMRNLGSNIKKEYLDFLNDGVLYDKNMDLIAKPFINQSNVEIYNWLELDRVMEAKLKFGWDKLSKQATQKDALWLQNPWLTANAISEASLDFFFAGVAVVGAAGFVQSAIQLWNMLRQTGYLDPPSSSSIVEKNSTSTKERILLFDHLMEVFGDKVFSGPPPKSGFLKQWDLMMGVRAEDFARGKRQLKKTAEPSLRSRAHNESGRGIVATISELYNVHEANYFTTDTSASQKRSSGKDDKHPLAATLDLANSELGQSATLPSEDSFQPRGPLLNLNLFKIHRLCVRIFTELEPILRPDIELFIRQPLDHEQINWPYLTGWIARTEGLPGNNNMPDRVMLKKAAEVVQRLAGDKELGFFLMREEADENLIL
ncbi:hypothetical protein BDZ97DRAFT_1922220 [Flammula alnicola]|nr:hypothetical protein BDZ97DRAFT_1922220 [Flammula alnicola]